MTSKVMSLEYASSLTNFAEVNSSFDRGVLRIAYTGQNRNGSFISKETFERCIPTIYNCPIVISYDRDSDTIGGHDIDIVREDDGSVRLVNLTTPIGCIPESANVFWETVEEDDGSVHEYLCADALIWKRQEGYRKLRDDGITKQSMEITVKDGERDGDVYYIKDFEFTAFALIGCEPCFESASIEMFSEQNFKAQMSQMMHELKEYFSTIATSGEADNTPQFSDERGENGLDDIKKINDPDMTEEVIDGAEEFTEEPVENSDVNDDQNVEQNFEEEAEAEDVAEPVEEPTEDHADEETDAEGNFALLEDFMHELMKVLNAELIIEEDGFKHPRYWYVDVDMELQEVYAIDGEDCNIYGFHYEMDGDKVAIGWETKKRKKYVIVDFDEGEQNAPAAGMFEKMKEIADQSAEWQAKYEAAASELEAIRPELESLREFKQNADDEEARLEREAVFEQFEDLNGIEAFEEFRNDCDELSLDEIEEKCFAIRGKYAAPKFSAEPKSPKLKVTKTVVDNEPYGGLFTKYGIGNNK